MSSSVINATSSAFQRLIESCQRSHQHFSRAAAATSDNELKRLLEIYSKQRNRFAEELKAHLPDPCGGGALASNTEENALPGSDAEWLRWCLEADAASLREYQQALGAVSPSKTQFLISAQYSLMQQAHERMRTLASRAPACLIKTIDPQLKT
jgi:hypothetical protein